MSDALLLLLGVLSDADYRRIQDARARNLRVVRPGWSNRRRPILLTIAYVLAIVAMALLVVFTFTVVGS